MEEDKDKVFRIILELCFHSKKIKKDTCGFEAQYPFGFLNFIFGFLYYIKISEHSC